MDPGLAKCKIRCSSNKSRVVCCRIQARARFPPLRSHPQLADRSHARRVRSANRDLLRPPPEWVLARVRRPNQAPNRETRKKWQVVRVLEASSPKRRVAPFAPFGQLSNTCPGRTRRAILAFHGSIVLPQRYLTLLLFFTYTVHLYPSSP